MDISYDDYIKKFNKAYEIFDNNSLIIDENIKNKISNCSINNNLFDNQLDNIKIYLQKNTSFSDLQIKNKIRNIYKV